LGDRDLLRAILHLIRVFRNWLQEKSPIGKIFTLFITLACFGIWATGKIQQHDVLPLVPLDKLLLISFGMHTFAIFLFIIFSAGSPKDIRKEYLLALRAAKQFAGVWYAVWILLLVFWAIMTAIQGVTFIGRTPPAGLNYALDLLSMAGAGCLLLSYLVMVLPSTGEHNFRWPRVGFLLALGCIVPVGLNAGIAAISPAAANASNPFFETAEGMLAGVALALLVGRLESKFIGSPIWVLVLLYSYAVLQGSYRIVVEWPDTIEGKIQKLLITSIALTFKFVLFWHIRQNIVSGRITEYMKAYRLLPGRRAVPAL
jgi:hypothetical protein